VSTALGIGLGGLGVFSRLAATQGLDLDFAKGVYALNGPRLPAFPTGWSFSRTDTNGTATALDLAGNVIQFATGVPRITNRGILVEEARTNGIRNSVAAGAVVGTPGTLPTNWTTFSGSNGLSPQIVAVGTDSVTGTGFVEVRFSGTTVNNTGSQIKFEGGIAATNAQAWTASVYAALVAGSVSGFTSGPLLQFDMNNSVPAYVGNSTAVAVAGSASMTRGSVTFTTNQATTAFVAPYIVITPGTGKTVDFTLRISLPQMELGAFATSPIITTGAAGTRGADVPVNLGVPTYSSGVTLVTDVEFLTSAAPATANEFVSTLSDATISNRISLFRVQGTSNVGSRAAVGGVNANPGDITGGAPLGIRRLGITVAPGRSISASNGTLSSGNTPTAVANYTQLNVGVGDAGTGSWVNGYIRRIRVLPFAATDAQLQALTAP